MIAAARDAKQVEGLTHCHYNYPARFSPQLVGQMIEAFTQPGDFVFDPYVGGGTTVVEAFARGRKAIGSDISTLATFVTRAKLLALNPTECERLEENVRNVGRAIQMHRPEPPFEDWAQLGYFRNLGSKNRWRLRKAIAQAVAAIECLDDPAQEALSRCAVLRTAHWALDGRKQLPTTGEFRRMLEINATIIARGAFALYAATSGFSDFAPEVLNRSIIGVNEDISLKAAGSPRLILTSPPYPGVHMLYHRWQVDGRKESPAPFFIANALDGSGETYYTMGGRGKPGLPAYFSQLDAGLRSLEAIADRDTTLVQVVAFAEPDWQLDRYLSVAANAGWEELFLPLLRDEEDGRLWRSVPNRKWHAVRRGQTGGSREVVLFHRLRQM
ncbi:MAG: DNA methyltransferase [Usitatibacteraceae bacterium]